MVSVRAYTPDMEKAWVRAYNRVSLSRKDTLFLIQEKPEHISCKDQLVLVDIQDQIIGFCDTAAESNRLRIIHFGVLPEHFPAAASLIADTVIQNFIRSDFVHLNIISGDTQTANLMREKGFSTQRTFIRFFCNAPKPLRSNSETENLFCDHVYAECPADTWKETRSSLEIIESDLLYPVTYQELVLAKSS